MSAAHDTQALLRQALTALESCGAGAVEDGGQQWFDDKLVDAAHDAIESYLASRLQEQEGQPALSALLERAAWICECYAEFIRSDVMSADIERHPYLPEIEGTAEDLRATLAAGSQAVQVPGWRPIDSAPKHTEVLVWRDDSGPFIAKLVTPEEVITPEEMEREGLEFADDFEEWFSDAYGWQDGSERPTHWQPLPAAPQQPLASGEVQA